MKKISVVLSVFIVIILATGCKKSSPSTPDNSTSTPSAATQTAVALLTAGPSAQATATAYAQLTANSNATETAIATYWTATSTATMTPTNTPVTIYAYISGEDEAGGMSASAYVYIYGQDSSHIASASVTIKNMTNSSQVKATYTGNYYNVQSPVYAPGDMYEVDVCIGNVTYTAQAAAPGPAQVDPFGNIVSWQSGGNENSISVDNPDNTQAFYESNGGTDNRNKTFDISSVYSSSGQYGLYSVSVYLENNYNESKGAFSGSNPGSSINVEYDASWDVFVTTGSTEVGTPTPTPTPSLRINAYINEDDQADGMSVSEYVYVYDGNNSSVPNASVTIKDLTASTQSGTFFNGNYYNVQSPVYVSGDMYEVDVCLGNVTYTAQAAAPGPADIDAQGDTLSWQNSGTNNNIYVYNPDGTPAFSQSNSGGSIGANSLDIYSVYPLSGQYGQYSVRANLETYKYGVFSGTSSESELDVSYNVSWDVFVEPGPTTIVGTPTPVNTPSLVIYAGINDFQSSVNDTINVRDMNGTSISTADVTIYNTTAVTGEAVPYNGNSYFTDNLAYIPGDSYEVDVFYNGITYSAGIVAPGPAALDAGGNTVTWQYAGNSNNLTVENPDGSQAFYQNESGNSGGNNAVYISPVYAASGQYGEYNVSLGLEKTIYSSDGAFAGSSANSYIYANDTGAWEVFVSPGTQIVGTPTPTP